MYKDKAVIDTIDLSGLSTYTLGRDADACEIPLEHASCSRRHARLERQADGSVWIEDLGSAQGTYVDGAPEPIAPPALDFFPPSLDFFPPPAPAPAPLPAFLLPRLAAPATSSSPRFVSSSHAAKP